MSKNHRILIIEDELVIAENTKLLIKQLYPKCSIEVAGDIKSAKDEIKNFAPTLALLDIRLGKKENGIVFSKTLVENEIPFIFLTAHGDHQTISDAIKTEPLGYMVKPVSRQDLLANLELAFYLLESQKYYSFKDGSHDVKLAEKDIVFLQVDGNYTEIHTADKRYILRKSMKKVLKDLHITLYRIHRNYYVNPKYVKEANASVYLSTGAVLPLSRNYKKALIDNVFSK